MSNHVPGSGKLTGLQGWPGMQVGVGSAMTTELTASNAIIYNIFIVEPSNLWINTSELQQISRQYNMCIFYNNLQLQWHLKIAKL